MKQQRHEEADGERFAFGANWAQFLKVLNDERINMAEASLKRMLQVDDLRGMRFIDVGSGSGLFSLAARRLGARVHSFDYDSQCVACTAELKRRYFQDDSEWVVEEGSILDKEYIDRLSEFDVVYSWGVLHHTGDMWQALNNVSQLAFGGRLFISIYNDQGRRSRLWLRVKRLYNTMPSPLRWLVLYPSWMVLWGPITLVDILRAKPFHTWRNYAEQGARSMHPWHDLVDWVGGLPFEVARPEEIFDFYREKDFQLDRLVTCGGGLGCNQFVFSHRA
jgi:SAM-dependent methyltransferase